jgi:hypothetical protein
MIKKNKRKKSENKFWRLEKGFYLCSPKRDRSIWSGIEKIENKVDLDDSGEILRYKRRSAKPSRDKFFEQYKREVDVA